MLRTHRNLEGLLCNPMRKMMKIIMRFLLLLHFNGTPVEWNWQGKTEVLGEKPVPVPLCPPQIPHGLTRDRTQASTVRGRRLSTWTMARPNFEFSDTCLCSPVYWQTCRRVLGFVFIFRILHENFTVFKYLQAKYDFYLESTKFQISACSLFMTILKFHFLCSCILIRKPIYKLQWYDLLCQRYLYRWNSSVLEYYDVPNGNSRHH
jgi:hypothetical protein